MPRGWVFGVVLVLAACAQPGGGSHSAAGPVHAAKPPADYAFIGSLENTDSKERNIGVNSDLLTDSAEDSRPTVFFGLEMAFALSDVKPERSASGGDGSDVAQPITFDPEPGRDSLKAAMNDLASRYPDRRDVKAYLFRSPSRAYLLLAEFETGAGEGALYYDVTSWGEAVKKKDPY
jgi:hypothetical protein